MVEDVDVVVADLLDGAREPLHRLRALAVGHAGELDGELHRRPQFARPIARCSSTSGTIRPWIGRIWSTARFSRVMLSARLTWAGWAGAPAGSDGAGRHRGIGIGLDEELLPRQVHHHRSSECMVSVMWSTSTTRAPSEKVRFPATASTGRTAARLGEVIGRDGGADVQLPLEIGAGGLARHDGDALAGEGAQPARVVEVMVGRDHVADRLGRGRCAGSPRSPRARARR